MPIKSKETREMPTKSKGTLIYQSKVLEITYWPTNDKISIRDMEAPALSDCVTFFPAREVLKASRAITTVLVNRK